MQGHHAAFQITVSARTFVSHALMTPLDSRDAPSLKNIWPGSAGSSMRDLQTRTPPQQLIHNPQSLLALVLSPLPLRIPAASVASVASATLTRQVAKQVAWMSFQKTATATSSQVLLC
mmetsp:Transcript_56433/g.125970  ORF Transcript_56433/g.125970 Transcript_56433/m.125970 type:complete len:118 (-) Transcript_56433:261-614(-)